MPKEKKELRSRAYESTFVLVLVVVLEDFVRPRMWPNQSHLERTPVLAMQSPSARKRVLEDEDSPPDEASGLGVSNSSS
jgi:hypothetical protein